MLVNVVKKWAIHGLFFLISVFSIQFTVNIQYKFLPMTGFEPWTSGIRSDRSTNWATTTAPPKRFLSLPVLFASSQFRAVLEAVAGPSSPSWTSWSRDPCSSSIPPSPSAAHFETSCSRDRPTQASNHLWKATEKVLLNVWCHFCSRYRVSFSRSLPTVIQHKTCGQSYKHFTLVNYDSRVVPDWKIPHITTLEFIKLATGPGQM